MYKVEIMFNTKYLVQESIKELNGNDKEDLLADFIRV